MDRFFWLAPCALLPFSANAAAPFPSDDITTSVGVVRISFLGHGTLMLTHGQTVIHVDPFGQVADYASLPKADLILITHEHFDHLDLAAIKKIRTDKTAIIAPPICASSLPEAILLRNGEHTTKAGIVIHAVPAYNIKHERAPGKPFHPRGVGNGYILTFGDTRLYIAGDTENTPEMKALTNITVAFLPMNLPYTMTPEMVADAARAFKPKILYPYHYGDTDPTRLTKLLKDTGIEVRIRPMR
ncbi:MAG: MBL fold metallo-hydrolase [bacterium]|nr:MBL fold metallo-hydrolase [bacterium]